MDPRCEGHTVQSLCLSGGRVVHKRQGARVRTIVYTVADGRITYGAEVFRPDDKSENWVRREANSHALERYLTSPVIVPDLVVNPLSPLSIGAQRERYVIRMTAEQGCFSDLAVDQVTEVIEAPVEEEVVVPIVSKVVHKPVLPWYTRAWNALTND